MQLTNTLVAMALAAAPFALGQIFPSCEPKCTNGQYCSNPCAGSCEPPLVFDDCAEYLYCRRESSSCGAQIIGDVDSPKGKQCNELCSCAFGAICVDPPTQSPTPTPSPSSSPSPKPTSTS